MAHGWSWGGSESDFRLLNVKKGQPIEVKKKGETSAVLRKTPPRRKNVWPRGHWSPIKPLEGKFQRGSRGWVPDTELKEKDEKERK